MNRSQRKNLKNNEQPRVGRRLNPSWFDSRFGRNNISSPIVVIEQAAHTICHSHGDDPEW